MRAWCFPALNRLHKHLFEIAIISDGQLTGIAEDIALAQAKRTLQNDAFLRSRPVETDIQGVYTLDLIKVQEEYPELSSKMILKSFIQTVPFIELTMTCRHVPPWLSQEKSLRVAQTRRGEYLMVTVSKRRCEEAMS